MQISRYMEFHSIQRNRIELVNFKSSNFKYEDYLELIG